MPRRKGNSTGIPGLSFSWERASGLSQAQSGLSRQSSIPLSKSERRRKYGLQASKCVAPVILMVLLIFLVSVAFAETSSLNNQTQLSLKKTVGIFIEVPSSFEIKDTTKSLMVRKTNVLFPANKFYILPPDITSKALTSYQPTNHIANVYKNKQLMHDDIQTIAKDLNCDYALIITIEKGLPSMSADYNSATYTTSILCNIRLLDVKNNSYISQKQITSETSSDSFKTSGSSYDNAYSDALAQALMEFNIDASSL